MTKKTLNIALFILLLSGASFAQQLSYSVDLNSTATHKVNVEINLVKMGAEKVTYQMPLWAPGAYSVTHYGHYVSNFKAYDTKGKELNVTQPNGDRWEISGAKNIAKITYTVADSHKDSTSLYFALAHIDTNIFFANGTCLFGYVNDKKDIPATVNYDRPNGGRSGNDPYWQLATALDPKGWPMEDPERRGRTIYTTKENIFESHLFDATIFIAKNYNELADAPVMAGSGFQTRTFKDGKAWYDIVLASDKPFPMDSLQECLHKIVHAETDFFHDTPFSHYTFLINAPSTDHMISTGFGALEHANSSAYLLVNINWNIFNEFGPAIFSHEFFHLWNVKRIHSSLLGPFDYTKQVKTTSLWLSEGITDYYAHTLLTRYTIASYKSFETMLTELTKAVENSKAANSKTLEELSIAESDFDLNNALVFYSKGTLVGLMLDIEIRSRTNNKKSLDDVMLALNAEAKKGKTFKDDELIGKIEKIVELDLQPFYKKYIAGTDALPIDEYLKKMGIGKRFSLHEESSDGNTDLKISNSGKLYVANIEHGSAMYKAGLRLGDTLLCVYVDSCIIGSLPVELLNTNPTKLKLLVDHSSSTSSIPPELRNSLPWTELTVALNKPLTFRFEKDYIPYPSTPLEVQIRHAIVGKDY